jgi:DNA-binding NarL/FixJ family response regulator
MINVVVISNSKIAETQILQEQADFNVFNMTASNIELAVAEASKFDADIFILDAQDAVISSEMLCHFLNEAYPTTRCLILTDEQPTFEMLQMSGFRARGYILPEQRCDIVRAVRVVEDGEAWLPRRLVAEMLNRFSTSSFQVHAA